MWRNFSPKKSTNPPWAVLQFFSSISSVRRQTSHRSLKNEQPRCSPPYELLCAPLPFGWLRQVRCHVSDRMLIVMVSVGWYLFVRPPAEKNTSCSIGTLGPGSFCVAGWIPCVLATNLLCSPPSSCGVPVEFLFVAWSVLCWILALARAPSLLG